MSTTDGRVPALAAGLERAARRLGHLEDEHRELARLVAQLADTGTRPRPLTSTLDQPPNPAVLEDLLDWLGRVYLAYPGAELAPCWPWHPGVVEELLWLRGAHHAAYTSGDPLRVGDWHDRYRPGVARRISAALRACDITNHQTTPSTTQVPLSDALSAIYTARANQQPIPAPSDDQIHQARALDQHHRTQP